MQMIFLIFNSTGNVNSPHNIKMSELKKKKAVQIFIDKIVPVYNSQTKFDLHS